LKKPAKYSTPKTVSCGNGNIAALQYKCRQDTEYPQQNTDQSAHGGYLFE
jgi:hypothetical protein